MPRLAFLAPLILATFLVACGGGDYDGTRRLATHRRRPPPRPPPQPTAAEDKPTPEAAPAGVTDEPVRFETSDGVAISGHLYSGGGPKRKVVVLAHEFPRDQTAWTAFAQQLAAAGIDALTFDFRGYGETGGDKDVAKIDLDLESAARFIASRDYAQVYLFGASMGGTAAIKVAARLDLAGLVTISAPDQLHGTRRPHRRRQRQPSRSSSSPQRGDDGAPDAVDYFMQQASRPQGQHHLRRL